MSIISEYSGKVISIVGFQTNVGKVVLKKILTLMGDKVKAIVLIDTKSRNEGKFDVRVEQELLEQDVYLKGCVKREVGEKIRFMFVDNKSENKLDRNEIVEIDFLFNCYIPQNSTKSSIEKCLHSHVEKTTHLCNFLKSTTKISKVILISSIYSQNFGYVTESDGQINRQPLGYSPGESIPITKLKDTLSDIFSSNYEIWQWSVLYMENLWVLTSGAESVEVVRIPQVGPTIENFEGYTPKFNTLTFLIYEIGRKHIDAMEGYINNVIDIIPADFVAHYMLTIAVVCFNDKNINEKLEGEKEKRMIIHNLSSSSRNPLTLGRFAAYINDGWVEYTPDYLRPINLKIHEKHWERKAYQIKSELPNNAKSRLAHLFDIKSWKIESQQKAINNNKKIETINKYRFFLEHEWICESNKSIDYFSALSTEDQARFNFNVNSINWKTYAKLCCYTVYKHLMGRQVETFNPSNLDLLHAQKSTYFSDIMWALSSGKTLNALSSDQMKHYVLSTKSVKEAIKQLVEEQAKKLEQTPTSYEKIEAEFEKVADDICTQMFSQYSMGSIRGFAWFLHKIFKTIYEKVVVDRSVIMKFKNHDEKTLGPLIIIPTHRSYIDFLILSFVFFGYGIKVPHIAAAEDFLGMAVVHILMRRSGAFFIKRDQKKYKNLYKAIMNEYISKLLAEQHYLEFFIEGTRSRVGKMLEPKYGILSIVCKNVMEGKIPDAQILPVTINFEKILEGQSYTYEMMGESKVKESLSRVIKAADVLKENFGRIIIELCEPIPVKAFFNENMSKFNDHQYERTLNMLGYKIVYSLTNNLVITSPAIISSIILMDRIGISDDRLNEKGQWLCREIASRNIKIARTQSDSSISLENALTLMGDIVNKSKKDMYEVQVSFDQNSFVQLFTLTYYRNTLTHIFFEEALVMTAMASFGYQELINCKINIESLREATFFLAKLLQKEYILENYIGDNPEKFIKVIDFMVARQIINFGENPKEGSFLIGTKSPDSNIFLFNCSLIWPTIESYWICTLYLFKLLKDKITMDVSKLQSEIQWFGQSIFSERIILHLEAISIDTIKNALAIFKSMKIIEEVQAANKKLVKILASEENLQALEAKISKFLKGKYASTFKGTLGGSGRNSVSLDFPFLSKL